MASRLRAESRLYARLHRRHRQARRRGGHHQGVAAQPPIERQDPLPDPPRRHRLHPGGDVEGRGRRGACSRPPIICRRKPRSSSPARRAPTRARRAATKSTSRQLEVVGESHDYPITPKEHGVDYLLDRRHLWIRSERQQAILRVRHEIINAVRDFFNSRGFILADTPIFTPAACEGTTTLFPAQYFEDQTAYLTQSGQLYNEANAMALGRVYCFGPTFRAEKSKTRRHLTEFWMVEPEMAYADLERRDGSGRRARRVGRRARARDAAPRAERPRARRHEARSGARRRFRGSRTTRRSKMLQGRRARRFEWGGDFGGPDETLLSSSSSIGR